MVKRFLIMRRGCLALLLWSLAKVSIAFSVHKSSHHASSFVCTQWHQQPRNRFGFIERLHGGDEGQRRNKRFMKADVLGSSSSSTARRSSSAVTTTTDSDNALDEQPPSTASSREEETKRQRIILLRVLGIMLGLTGVFGAGFRVGGGDAELLRLSLELFRRRVQQRRLPFLSALGIVLLVKDVWRTIPDWAKPSLTRGVRPKQQQQRGGGVVDSNDLTDVDVIASKLKTLFDVAQGKLGSRDEEKVQTFGPFLALLQLLEQLKERRAEARRERFEKSGRAGTLNDIKGLAENFEFADWAYDESPLGSLKENLEREGFSLLRHDKTTLPGYVGHYVALNKKRKLAVIGVKGTSNFEDMLTDCCGLAVSHKLDAPFSSGPSTTEIRCHEGILISSKRLAHDIQPFVEELLLPRGFQILLVGHSLGAAGAAMLAVLLRSRIPALAADSYGRKLRVLAYACPPILDYKNAKACEKFITTIVNNSDVIPRASLSNLIISLEILKDVNKKLAEKGMDGSTGKSTISFLNKLAEGTKGELLMEEDELVDSSARAAKKVDRDDPDHLFVPGKVIIMYDKMREEKEKAVEKDVEFEKTAQGFVVSEDGAAEVLRTIEWNERMVSDHLSQSIRSSLKSVIA